MSEQMQARYERQLLQWQHSSNYWYSQFSLCQAERDALRAECERWKGTAREASQSVIWYSERVEWLLSATDIDPHQEGEAIMQALHDRLAEQDALRERVAVLERVAEAAAEWQESRREYHEVMCNGRRETVKQYERYRDAELGLDKALEADR